MRRFVLGAVVLAVLPVLLSAPVVADKTTVDPNTVLRVQDLSDKPDTRLDQKVTYEATCKPVRTIIADLAKLTGVTLKAGGNEKDWKVRDRRMNIFAKDTPLKDLMDSIERVMKFQWASAGEGDKRTYRLFEDKKSMLEAESRRVAREEWYDKALADKRSKALDNLCRTEPYAADELAKMKTESPFDYYMATTSHGPARGAMLREIPALKNALASGQEAIITNSSLSASAREALIKAVADVHPDSDLNELTGGIGSLVIHVNDNPEAVRIDSLIGFLGNITLHWANGKAGTEMYLYDGDGEEMKHIYTESIAREEGGGSDSASSQDEGHSHMGMLLSDIAKWDCDDEAAIEHPFDPDLQTKIKMEVKSDDCGFQGVQRALHEASGFAVVSDRFGRSGPGVDWPAGVEIEIAKALDNIGQGYRYNWDRHKSVLELRDKNWYRKRALQIPDEQLDEWLNRLKKNGFMDIDDLSEIAALSTEQVVENCDSVPLDYASYVVSRNKRLLRFYGSLSETQRSLVLSDTGLNLAGLTADQMMHIRSMVLRETPGLLQFDPSQLILTATKKPVAPKGYTYTFTLSAKGSVTTATWALDTPRYNPPPAEKQPEPKEEQPKEAAPAK